MNNSPTVNFVDPHPADWLTTDRAKYLYDCIFPLSPLLLHWTWSPTASKVVVEMESERSTKTTLESDALSSGVVGENGRVLSISKTYCGSKMCSTSS